jgi:hypothetical protein
VLNVLEGSSVLNTLFLVTGTPEASVADACTVYRVLVESAHSLCHDVPPWLFVPSTGLPSASAVTFVSVPFETFTDIPVDGSAFLEPRAGVIVTRAWLDGASLLAPPLADGALSLDVVAWHAEAIRDSTATPRRPARRVRSAKSVAVAFPIRGSTA